MEIKKRKHVLHISYSDVEKVMWTLHIPFILTENQNYKGECAVINEKKYI